MLRVIRTGMLLSVLGAAATVSALPTCPDEIEVILGLDVDIDALTKRPGSRRLTGYLEDLSVAIEKEKDPEKLIDSLVANDVRGTAFRLEEITDFYKDRSDDIAKLHVRFKRLEDTMGVLDGYASAVKSLEGMKVPATLKRKRDTMIAYMKGRYDTERATFAKFLVREGWLAPDADGIGPMIQRALKTIEDESWQKPRKDRKHVAEALMTHLERMETKPYNMTVLQGPIGIHELRRDLRRIIIQAQATDGLILLKADKHPEKLDPRLQKALADYASPESRKYVTFKENPLQKNPIHLSESSMFWVSDMVSRLGKVKDLGEAEDSIIEALIQTGLAKNATDARRQAEPFAERLKDFDPKNPSVVKRAGQLYREIRQVPGLEQMIKEIKKAID